MSGGNVMSQEEIDALLAKMASGGPPTPEPSAEDGDEDEAEESDEPVFPAVRRRARTVVRGPRWAAPGLDDRAASVAALGPVVPCGRVARVVGHEVEIRGISLRVGEVLDLIPSGSRDPLSAEVISVAPDGARAVVFGETDGIGRGDLVERRGRELTVDVTTALLGRIIDAHGRPLDGRGPIVGQAVSVVNPPPQPLVRRRIDQALSMGVKVLDALCTTARGQRLGLFGGSGVGKSTLLGMMARGTAADVNVVALIGERGREVREFIEDDLGPEGLARSVVIVATSDQPPLVRRRAGDIATRIAEWFADEGCDVLLLMDSLTRLAMAQRDIGLAAGEPPTARGYTPSVFSMMPKLLERAGPRTQGTVTAFYTVLVEGDDMNDPIADAARGILDGHIVLDRQLAIEGRYPAIDPLQSLSRLQAKVADPEMLRSATALRTALAALRDVKDLVEVGAYVPGTNPVADRALAARGDLHAFLTQTPAESPPLVETANHLAHLADRLSDGAADAA